MPILPAAIAIFIAEFCFGLIMLSIYRRDPDNKSTGYWGIGMLLIGSGILLTAENAGAAVPWKLMLGNGSIMLGATCHWWGLQLFYHRRRARAGFWLMAAFLLSFGLAVVLGASLRERSVLISLFVLVPLLGWLHEVWLGQRGRHGFASRLVLLATVVLLLIYAGRVVLLLNGAPTGMGRAPGVLSVALLYFTPPACLMLCGAGLMMLYLERIIADNRRLANEDALTGLLNRGAIAAAGERAVTDALRGGTALTVAMLDLDFFKEINDSLGHDAGDQVLIDFAQLLRAHCRHEDQVGRYGGEEFCILFHGMDERTSAAVTARILDAVRAYRHHQTGTLTVSIGIAVLPRNHGGAVTWTQLIKAADQRLYLAKQNGRDQSQLTVLTAGSNMSGRRAADLAAM